MAQTTIKLRATNFAFVDRERPSEVIDISGDGGEWIHRYSDQTIPEYVYTIYEAFPANLKNKRLYSIKAVYRYTYNTSFQGVPGLSVSSATINPSTLTWSNRPGATTNYWLKGASGRGDDVDCTMAGDSITDAQRSEFAAAFLKTLTTMAYCATYGDTVRAISLSFTLTDNSAPYIEITYDDSANVTSKITQNSCPTSGYVNPRNQTVFKWTFEKNDTYYCAGGFDQASATLYWRVSGESTWNSIAASGSTKSVTVAANTFPAASTIEWYLAGTDTAGTASQTQIYSFSTAAGTVTATPLSPINTVESNNEAITFRWKFSSADGFPPSRYELWWKLPSEDNQSWHELVDTTNVAEAYTVAANTFPASEIQWMVRPYNIDGTFGIRYIVSFISYGAPEAPVVYAPAVPFTTISWQAADQQGYEIQVDGTAFGPYFGTEKSFALPDFLPDGNHDVRVRVIGSYGLWSEWGSTSVTIENIPGEDIELSGEPSVEPVLTWTTEEATSDFLIYRDGVQIGHTAGTEFRDRYAAGEHTYKVVNRLASGNYSESNELALSWEPDAVYISLLRSGEWIRIICSEQGEKDPSFEETAENSFDHLSGDIYPSAALSGYKTGSLSWSAIFLQEQSEERRMFESLLGKAVIMKTRDGSVYVGVMGSVTKKPYKLYYVAYSFTLQRIEWEDYTDDTQ